MLECSYLALSACHCNTVCKPITLFLLSVLSHVVLHYSPHYCSYYRIAGNFREVLISLFSLWRAPKRK